MTKHQQLQRRLGVADATAIGLGSMLGAGVFVVFAPAARLAGELLLAAIALAGAVAYCNAVASAQLAAKYPQSGGTYIYGRKQLGEWPGFLAGWGFVTGKSASCAAMALTFGQYVAPGYAIPVAIAAVAALTGVNLLGITRTAFLTRILLAIVLATLAFVAAASIVGPHVADGGSATSAQAGAAVSGQAGNGWGILPAAGLVFFAFAGYARIATLGEEVKDPERAIPRAILGALAAALVIYLLLGVLLLAHLPVQILAASTAPLLDAVEQSRLAAGAPVVQAGAAAASLGALLALITGVGRTAMAMARESDLPGPLARVGGRHPVPATAELAVAAVVVVLLLTTDVLTVVGFSSFGVLLYYAVTNAAAFTLRDRPRHAPKWLNAAGLAGCLVLAFTLPAASVLGMAAVMAAGLAGRAVVLAFRKRGFRKRRLR
ncbi:APC family permease [Arthrobacter sp. FW305-BF8]|uniref:APC family permease n=1 Tax=Arthrobacter sp. FW305-BF8 TaxID=2879617 RepID=UPI001F3176EA|nr:APC family permease [Arthrobacter sp. FW305-BF8]UKA52590.1 APC family permease [Arthrobacter sp. FW305-BF8]